MRNDFAKYLIKHRKPINPTLNHIQRKEIVDCFNLLDGDGSGAIGSEELAEAFSFMEVTITKEELRKMVALGDVDGSGSIEYGEFVDIMTSTMEGGTPQSPWEPPKTVAVRVNFPMLATAYRRRKRLAAIDTVNRTQQQKALERAFKEQQVTRTNPNLFRFFTPQKFP